MKTNRHFAIINRKNEVIAACSTRRRACKHAEAMSADPFGLSVVFCFDSLPSDCCKRYTALMPYTLAALDSNFWGLTD